MKTVIRLRTAVSAVALAAAALSPAAAQEETTPADTVLMDEISVTATRSERRTQEVPSSISVVGQETIEANKMFNIKEAIQSAPGVLIDTKNGGYSTRLIIRGAGQKAAYGVREIMVLRDGVPMTDPDSFTRFDFVDMQDVERIEVTKGPGSIYGAGAAGGTIQILSKSVFDETSDRVRLMGGTSQTSNAHARYGTMIGDSNAIAITMSRRAQENDWRRWNKFESTQASFKHGYMFDDGGTWETELSYSAANLQLPGSMDEELFDYFVENGKQLDSYDAWKHSGRDSKIWFFNTRMEKELGDFTLKPQFYFNHWSHFHPVTGGINNSPHNLVYGIDVEVANQHAGDIGPNRATGELVAGFTVRQDNSIGARKYKYRDFTENAFSGRITETHSDAEGALMEDEDAINTIYGIYAKESIRPNDRFLVDLAFRYDLSIFNINQWEWEQYSYSDGNYIAGDGYSETDKTYQLFAPSLGISYALSDSLNVYGSVAQSDQVPSTSEIQSNTSLNKSTSRSFEIGLKGRAKRWAFDAAAYHTTVEDEIVSTVVNDETVYDNAAKVIKRGLELAGEYEVMDGLKFGATYAYSNYIFDEFLESVSDVNFNRAGNSVPYVPKHKYGLTASYHHSSGLKARLQTDSWGEYHLDNANSEMYGGYDFVTNLSVGYERAGHSLSFGIENLTDKHYAAEVKKSTTGTKTFAAAQPRTFLLTYQVTF